MDIATVTTSDGLELQLGYIAPVDTGRPVLLCTHGVANNFASTPLRTVAELLAKRGIGAAILSNRGHDWLSMNRRDQRWIGAAYERFEDSALDLGAAAAWLRQQGHERIVLAGHSLGGLKVGYTAAHALPEGVVGVALCSAPRLPDDKFWDMAEYRKLLSEAERRVSEGRPEELMFVPMPTNTPALKGVFTAATYVNKYGPRASTTMLRYVERISPPTLVLAGTKEPPQLDFAREVARAIGATLAEIEGADHLYSGREEAVAQALGAWLDQISG